MHFEFRSPISASQSSLSAWHQQLGAFERLSPPWEKVVRVSPQAPLFDGLVVRLRVPVIGPIYQSWTARHHSVSDDGFIDEQQEGPFRSWVHAHRFLADGAGSVLEDVIDCALPLAPFSAPGRPFVEAKLRRMFAYRHAITAGDLAAHTRRNTRPMRIAVTGASGLVGRALVPYLQGGGHQVVTMVRQSGRALRDGERRWNPSSVDDTRVALEGVDAVVHLAGAGIADARWTDARKQLILESRVGPTRVLAEAIAGMKNRPSVFVASSGIPYSGNRRNEPADESCALDDRFLGDVVRAWEDATAPAANAGTRVVNLRTGVVLAGNGGALTKMLPAFQLGVGAVLGTGHQWMSVIGIDDFLDVVLSALTDKRLTGPVNAVMPEAVTNRAFTETLGRVLRRPAVLAVPGFALRAVAGEVVDETLLSSARVAPAKLNAIAHPFRFRDLESVLRHVLGR